MFLNFDQYSNFTNFHCYMGLALVFRPCKISTEARDLLKPVWATRCDSSSSSSSSSRAVVDQIITSPAQLTAYYRQSMQALPCTDRGIGPPSQLAAMTARSLEAGYSHACSTRGLVSRRLVLCSDPWGGTTWCFVGEARK